MPFRLDAGEGLAGGVRRIAHEQLRGAVSALSQGTGDRDDDIHTGRKAMKRMRGLVRLVRRDLGGDLYRTENDTYRDAARRLADLRDATVLVATLDSLRADLDETVRDVADGVRHALEEERRSAYARKAAADDQDRVVDEVAEVLRAADERVDTWPLEGAGWKTVADGAGRIYARGREEHRACCQRPTTEGLHEWRKRVKYLMYQSQMLQPLWSPLMKAWQAELDDLGDLLGDDHDLAVLYEALSERLPGAEGDALRVAIEARRHRLQQEALQLGARVYADRPEAFTRRWRVWWNAWQAEHDGAAGERAPVEAERVADTQCRTGEGPLWHADEGRLYWVDIPAGELWRYDPQAQRHEKVFEAGCAIGGFTQQADGSLLLFLAGGAIAVWREGRDLAPVVAGIDVERESRFNDVIADPAGRVFCGTMPSPGAGGRLYRLDTDGSLTELLDGIGCSNGMGFSPDDRRFYYIDTPTRRIDCFDYDAATGELSNRRLFADLGDEEGAPDGMTVDGQGRVWCAMWGGHGVLRLGADGQVERRLPLPAAKVSSLTFAGPELTDLYVTTAGGDDRSSGGPGAGALFRLRPGIVGRAEFRSRVGLPAGDGVGVTETA
jgi:sugar lactone lactonase YvrE/CHAD domain-containing protein